MPASLEQQWSPEEDALIRSLVKQGYQLKDMPPHLPKRTRRGIECRVYTLGLKSGNPRTKHSKDEAFWEVPNPLNSYYAGLLAADGSVDSERHILQWVCEWSDKAAMEGLAKASRFTGSIGEYLKKSPRSDHVAIHCRFLCCACQKWNADLARNFNVVPQKAHRLAPPSFVNDLLACCYLIGYIDGDGCVHPGRGEQPCINFVSASRAILEWIKSFVERHFPFQIRAKPKRIRTSAEGGYHHYSVKGMTAIKLFAFLRSIDVPKFPRKWDNTSYLALVEQYKERWPAYFTPEMTPAFDSAGNIVRASQIVVERRSFPV